MRQQGFANFQYVRWGFLEQPVSKFRTREGMEQKCKHFLSRVDRKTRLVFVSKKFSTADEVESKAAFQLFAEASSSLKDKFDGFTMWELNCPYGDATQPSDDEAWHHFRFVTKHCFVFLASPYEDIYDSSWLRYEAVGALLRRRLVLNNYAEVLIDRIGTTQPTLAQAQKFVEQGAVSYPQDQEMLDRFLVSEFELTKPEFDFKLIPIGNLPKRFEAGKSCWKDINSVGVWEDYIDRERVLMVSHKWATRHHPDQDHSQLRSIIDYINENREAFDYLFYDFVCLDKKLPIESLVKVDTLYATAPCLCLTNDRYLRSSWCLFELCISSLNRGNPTKRGSIDESHELFRWLKQAKLVKEMGFVHTLQTSAAVLDLPTDRLHLKTQLRALFTSESTTITNPSDRSLMLNLLDQLI